MKHLREHWFPYLLCGVILVTLLCKLPSFRSEEPVPAYTPDEVPDFSSLSYTGKDELIRYGRELITNTADYFGPHGRVAAITNGLDCGNCHMEAGTKLYTNNFMAVRSTYPKFRERSGRVESVEFRINECMQRSLNGKPIDSLSREMRAMVAYILWTGKNAGQQTTDGVATKELKFIDRAADTANGANIYVARCLTCHGVNGDGLVNPVGAGYTYPPLWGDNSYAVSAGMFRLSKLAAFVKYNMPLGATFTSPTLSDDEAWDVAAYINSKPHPQKMFAYDWPVIRNKPVDYPFGPYADNFSETEHKYGPFAPMLAARAGKK